MHLANTFQRQSTRRKTLQLFAAIVVTGAFDVITGYHVSFSIIYGVLIYVAAWSTDKQTGILVALLCAISWWWASMISERPYLNNLQEIWETFIRIAFFVFVAIGAASLKREHDEAETRIALLEHSRQLEREIVEISEREQRRIGRDLHDGICQTQAALACAAASLNGDLTRKNLTDEARRADELAKRLRDAIAETRNLARGLVPVQMEEMGLASALEELAWSVSRLQQIDCRFEAKGAPDIPENTAATHLYRIAQEAINNAVRHGKAKRVDIIFQATPALTTLSISDDGIGVANAARLDAGMGMNIMRYRAKLAGGDLVVSERAEGGTNVACRMAHAGKELHAVAT